MILGIYSDPHFTKKLPGLDEVFRECVINTYKEMYSTFKDNNVEMVICSGDLFDKPVLDASSVDLFKSIMLEAKQIPTYYLLGNHEILDASSNIIKCVDSYRNQHSVTELCEINGLVFIPYDVDLDSIDLSKYYDKILFTHHDILGSTLAGGSVKASFGLDPNLFNKCKVVFNGHIHLRSTLGKVINLGSLFTTQYAELNDKDYNDCPKYYIYNTDTGELTSYTNSNNLYFYTATYDNYIENYNKDYKHVVRFVYTKDDDISKYSAPDAIRVNYKRLIEKVNKDSIKEEVSKVSNFSIKDMINKYVMSDDTISEDYKKRILTECDNILEEVSK